MSIWDHIPIPKRFGVAIDRVRSNKFKYPPHTDIRKFCDRDCDFLIPSVIYYCVLMGFTIASFLSNPTTHGYFLGPFAVALVTCYYHNVKASFYLRTVAHMEIKQFNAVPPQIIASYYYRVVNVMFLLCCLAFIPMNLEIIGLEGRLVYLLGAFSIPSIVYNIYGSVKIQKYGDALIGALQQQWHEERMARAAAICAQEIYEAGMEQIAENNARAQASLFEPPPSYATGLLAPKPEDFEGGYIFENGGFRAESPPPGYHVVEMRDSNDKEDEDDGRPNVNDVDDSNIDVKDDDDNEDKDDDEGNNEEPVAVIVISF